MYKHEIIGGAALITAFICVLLLIWTNFDYKIIFRIGATSYIVYFLCKAYDEAYYEDVD